MPPNPKALTPAWAGPSVLGQGSRPRANAQWQGIKVNVRVRLGEIEARGYQAAVQGQGRLDQTGDTGRGLEVADVRLDRTQGTFSPGVTSSGEHSPEGGELDGIAKRSTRAVRFDIIDELGARRRRGDKPRGGPLPAQFRWGPSGRWFGRPG